MSVLMEHQSLTNSHVHLEHIITGRDAQELRTVSVAGLACIAQLKECHNLIFIVLLATSVDVMQPVLPLIKVTMPISVLLVIIVLKELVNQ